MKNKYILILCVLAFLPTEGVFAFDCDCDYSEYYIEPAYRECSIDYHNDSELNLQDNDFKPGHNDYRGKMQIEQKKHDYIDFQKQKIQFPKESSSNEINTHPEFNTQSEINKAEFKPEVEAYQEVKFQEIQKPNQIKSEAENKVKLPNYYPGLW